MEPSDEMQAIKQALRVQALADRQRQANKPALSREICGKLAQLPEYQAAATVMFYVNMAAEVETGPFLPEAQRLGKRIVIPCCIQGRIEVFRWESMDDLTPSKFGVLEPKPEVRRRSDRRVEPQEVDLVVVPGVAFDPHGGRLGHGKGYYDGLLPQMRAGTPFVALAFECQIVAEIPMQPHDVRMHKVITERTIYEALGR